MTNQIVSAEITWSKPEKKENGPELHHNNSSDEIELNVLKTDCGFGLLNLLKDMIVIIYKNGEIVYVNNSTLNFFRIEKKSIIGKNIFSLKFFSKESKQQLKQKLTVAMNNESIGAFEVKCNDNFNNEKYFELDINIIDLHEDNGVILQLKDLTSHKKNERLLIESNSEMSQVLVKKSQELTKSNKKLLNEINKRKEREKSLRMHKRHFETLFNMMVDPVVIVDKKGTFLELTKRVYEITGFKREELLGKNFFKTKIVTDKSKIILLKKLAQRMMGKNVGPYEVKVLTKDKRKLPFEVNAAKINYMDKPADMVVFRDLSERKKAEEKYQVIFENSAVGIILTDDKNRIISNNDFLQNLLGYKNYELEKKSFKSLYPKEEWNKIFNDYIQDKEVIHHLETKMKTKNHELIDVDISMSRLKDEAGKTTGYIGVISDVTERKKMEEDLQTKKEELDAMNQELVAMNEELMASNEKLRSSEEFLKMMNLELNVYREQVTSLNRELESKVEERTSEVKKLLQQKDDFIHQLSHDLKTPLAPILSILPFIEEDITDPKSKEALHVVLRSTEYMKKLVHSTLELARLNSPSHKLEYNTFNVSDEINAVIETNKVSLDEKNISIQTDIDEDLVVNADKLKIDEVLNNLISNCIKYSKEKDCFIKLSAQNMEDEKSIIISVEDNGIGMNKEQVDKIFDEFYKADESRHAMDSSGLGLPICKRIVEKHGGRIWAESKGLGKGSTFHFTFPKSAIKGDEDISEIS